MSRSENKAYFEKALCEIETPKALFISWEGQRFCVPKSLVDDDSEVYQKGDEGTLVLPEWFAIKEGLV